MSLPTYADAIGATEVLRSGPALTRIGRPPAGHDGSKPSTYPRLRVEPGLLERLNAAAAQKGVSARELADVVLREAFPV